MFATQLNRPQPRRNPVREFPPLSSNVLKNQIFRLDARTRPGAGRNTWGTRLKWKSGRLSAGPVVYFRQNHTIELESSSRIAVAERSTDPAITNAAQDVLNLQNAKLCIQKPERWNTTEHQIRSFQPVDHVLVAADEVLSKGHNASHAI